MCRCVPLSSTMSYTGGHGPSVKPVRLTPCAAHQFSRHVVFSCTVRHSMQHSGRSHDKLHQSDRTAQGEHRSEGARYGYVTPRHATPSQATPQRSKAPHNITPHGAAPQHQRLRYSWRLTVPIAENW